MYPYFNIQLGKGVSRVEIPANIPITINYNPHAPDDVDLIHLSTKIDHNHIDIAVSDIESILLWESYNKGEFVYLPECKTSESLNQRNTRLQKNFNKFLEDEKKAGVAI
jgi:hypothetical protein